MSFGTNLRKYRKSKNLSQAKLAKLTNIPQTTISDWETEKTSPNLKQIKVICDVLNISVIELLDETN